MNISSAEYLYAMDDIMSVFEKHKIDEGPKKDVLSILWSLKETIISK